MYLLDTDILVRLLRGQPTNALLAQMRRTPRTLQFVSSVSAGELWYGAYKMERRVPSEPARVETLLNAFEILPFEGKAAQIYGEVRLFLERQGNQIGDADTRIAAIALSRGLTVVTGNVRHFHLVPSLAVENWLEARSA